MRPEPNWAGLIQAGAPDAEAVEAHLLQHASGLRVLASPFFPVVEPQGLSRAMIQTTLSVLQQRFAVIIVDAPPVLDEVTMVALEAATVIGLVITAEAPSIQTSVGTLRALKQWSSKLQIILNQVAPGPQLPAGAIERTLKRPLAGTIPFDPNQAQALARGAPLALHNPTAPLAQAVQELARGLDQQLLAVSR